MIPLLRLLAMLLLFPFFLRGSMKWAFLTLLYCLLQLNWKAWQVDHGSANFDSANQFPIDYTVIKEGRQSHRQPHVFLNR